MDEFEKYYNKAIRFLSYRPRSEKEVMDNLTNRRSRKKVEEVDQGVIEQVINRLKEQRFLNDEEFARWWIEQRMEFKPRSLSLIKRELKQKGITNELIEKAVDGSLLMVHSDSEQAKRLVAKKIKKYKAIPKQEIYQKLGRFLAQKGFDWNTIKQSIDETLKEGV